MRLLILYITLLTFLGCGRDTPHPYSFYYWKTDLKLDSTEKEALKKATASSLYVRYFDVDRINGRLQPLASVMADQKMQIDKQIIPVIYITNRSFLNITSSESTLLANGIAKLIAKKNIEIGAGTPPEIQIDCDWTTATRDNYFHFLKELKKLTGKNITSTLRLHQVRDSKETGIPPVDRVYLMCYSTSSPLENSAKNSILHVPTLKNYLQSLNNYPIKIIAIALPIYSWRIVKNHLGKHQLINALSAEDLKNPNFTAISSTEVKVEKDGFYFGYYLNKGFTIKIEEITEDQLTETKTFLDTKLKNYDIVYYHLDKRFINHHPLK